MEREIDGFLMNRLQGALLQEAFRLVDQGIVGPEAVDDTATAAARSGGVACITSTTLVLNTIGAAMPESPATDASSARRSGSSSSGRDGVGRAPGLRAPNIPKE